MRLLDTLARWEGPAAEACRPFDTRRCGWVPGEGAGIFILEELEHAKRRGAKVYGEVLGYGAGTDGYQLGGLDPQGAGSEIALRAALRDAGLKPIEVGHINAHGTGQKLADLAEARAINRVFGRDVPVTALKGYMGNLASGCGAVELISSLAAATQGLIPATLNCDQLDPECEIDVVRGEARPTSNPVFINLNFTRHGQATALVVRGNPDFGPLV
jgi:3-oxoacyl-[acyl-carrier-protein] synthase II